MAAPRPQADGDLGELSVDLGPDLVIDLTQPLQHRPELVESGSFTSARCRACGWSGPARRARAVALADLERHATQP